MADADTHESRMKNGTDGLGVAEIVHEIVDGGVDTVHCYPNTLHEQPDPVLHTLK